MCPSASGSRLFSEAAESPDAVRRQLERNAEVMERIGRRLRTLNPPFVVTVARGSSDHAATFAKYLLETRCGIFTVSAGPSVFSVYASKVRFDGSLCLVISQSGASPDLLATARAARDGGAYVIAFVNVLGSPLAELAHDTLELHAGPEISVAASKSFIASLAAVIQLVAVWKGDEQLNEALSLLPGNLAQAWACDWKDGIAPLSQSRDLYVLGRGLGFGIALEAALKLKEVCGLHAEGFSAAEVLHGPVTIARARFPVLVLAQNDATLTGLRSLVDELLTHGAVLLTAGFRHESAIELPSPSGHPVVEPLFRILSFYRMADTLSYELGLDPDRPPYLQKVTSTF